MPVFLELHNGPYTFGHVVYIQIRENLFSDIKNRLLWLYRMLYNKYLATNLCIIEKYMLFTTSASLPVKCVKSVPAYFAERLYESMKVNALFLLHVSHVIAQKQKGINNIQLIARHGDEVSFFLEVEQY